MLSFSGSDFGNPLQAPIAGIPESPVSLMTSQDSHAAVGRQITISAPFPAPQEMATLDLYALLAEQSEVELVAHAVIDDTPRSWLLIPSGMGGGSLLQSDAQFETVLLSDLIALAGQGSEITFTVVPFGTGRRIALDRDEDGFLNHDENTLGSNPGDAGNAPDLCDLTDLIVAQYGALVTLLGLSDDFDGDGLPEEALLELINHLACETMPTELSAATSTAFQDNLTAFNNETTAFDPRIINLREIVAVLMMTGTDSQIALSDALADAGIHIHESYTVIESDPVASCGAEVDPAADPIEQLTGDGDLDGDGQTNAEEFQTIVVEDGGDLATFALEAADVCFSTGNASGSCFIATAAYGTPLAQEIDTLRNFRDKHLLGNPLGTAFVDTYYRLSPPIADIVSTNPVVAAFVRVLISGMVAMSNHLLICLLGIASVSWLIVHHKRSAGSRVS